MNKSQGSRGEVESWKSDTDGITAIESPGIVQSHQCDNGIDKNVQDSGEGRHGGGPKLSIVQHIKWSWMQRANIYLL